MRNIINVKNLVKKFFSLKIKTKFFISYILMIVMIAFAIGIITLYTSKDIIMKNTEQLSQQLINQIAVNVEYKAGDFEKFVFNFLNDSSAGGSTFKDNLDLINSGNYDPTINRTLGNIITKYVISYSSSINSLCLKTRNGQIYYWEKLAPNFNEMSSADNVYESTYNKAFKRLEQAYNGALWMSSEENENAVMFGKQIVDPDSLDSLGEIIFSLDTDYFKLLKDEQFIVKEANIAILNSNNEIISANKVAGIRQLAEYALTNGLLSLPEKSVSISYHDKQYIFTKIVTGDSKWKVLCFVPMEELSKNANTLKISIIIVCVCAIIVALGIAYIISFNVTKNINLLEKNMRAVEDGDFSVKIKPASYDEIGLLGLRFNYMVNKINDLINTVYNEKIAKQQAEFRVLLAQIRPHFLYNTLGSIQWLAHSKGQSDIEVMTASLIELLKMSVNNKGEFITVDEEISYTENYILLQRIRYEDRFSVEYDIDDVARQCYILKFIFQPLVENAIYHGIEMSKSNGIIKIKAKVAEGMVILAVEDNGVGMSEETIKKILNDEYKKIYPGLNSIGVKNVNERIKLYFGEQYGLNYISNVGAGTRVEVVLPIITELGEVKHYDEYNGG